MNRFLLILLCGWGVAPLAAQSTSPAWENFVQALAGSSPSTREKTTLRWDATQGLLEVKQEIEVHPKRIRRNIQVVPLVHLNRQIPIEGVGPVADPWLKVRVKDDRPRVQVKTESILDGEVLESEKEPQPQKFVIFHCRGSDVPKVRDAFAAFLAEIDQGMPVAPAPGR